MKGRSRKAPPPRPRGDTALGLGPLPKSLPPIPAGKFVVRDHSLPPEEGWFDPATLNDDTEPPPTTRLDAFQVDSSDVELSDDAFDDTVELPFSAALVSAVASPHVGSTLVSAGIDPSVPPPLPPQVSVPPPLPPEASVPPPLPLHASPSSLPPTAEIPQWYPIELPAEPALVSKPPMSSLQPELTGIPSSPWLVMPTDADPEPPVYDVVDEPSGDVRLSSAAVFVSRRPLPPTPRRGAGLRYAVVGLAAAAAIAAIGWGWHRRTTSKAAPAVAQASLSQAMPTPVVDAPPPQVEPKPEAPPPCAPLEVKAAPPGYQVFVDGKALGAAPGTFELDCGGHTVALVKGGRGVLPKTIRRIEITEKPTVLSYSWPDVAP